MSTENVPLEQLLVAQQAEAPSSAIGVFTLPCGYLDPATNELHSDVMMREITGYEEDMLASDVIPNNAKMDALLSACVQRVGTITDPGKISQVVKEMTVGDRSFLIFALRRVTLGNEFPMRVTCTNPRCRKDSVFVVDLSTLDIIPMKNPQKRVYDVKTPSGRDVRFKVSTGIDQHRVNKLVSKDKQDAMSLLMLMRVELVDGKAPALADFKQLGLRDRQFLRKSFLEVEGGVDTSIVFECKSCGHEWKGELDVNTNGFFSPSVV